MKSSKDLFTPQFWLRCLTNSIITADQIAVIEDVDIRTARKIVEKLTTHKKGTPYIVPTDRYLKEIRHTDRKTEVSAIYGKEI